MNIAGIAGGVWTWIISFFVKKAANEVLKELSGAASKQDQLNLNEDLSKEYQDLVIKGAPESELIDKETEILNGKRKVKP